MTATAASTSRHPPGCERKCAIIIIILPHITFFKTTLEQCAKITLSLSPPGRSGVTVDLAGLAEHLVPLTIDTGVDSCSNDARPNESLLYTTKGLLEGGGGAEPEGRPAAGDGLRSAGLAAGGAVLGAIAMRLFSKL